MREKPFERRMSRRRLLQVAAASAIVAAGITPAACDDETEQKEANMTAMAPTAERTALGGPMVETMTGPVATSDLGFTLMHEHIIVQSEGVSHSFPSVWDEQGSLDEATSLYERGQSLVKRCQELLDQAELKVKQLSGTDLADFEEA